MSKSTNKKRGRGQPTKLTSERAKIILEAISDGNYYGTACAAAGVDYTTYRNWMNKGEEGTAEIYVNFFNSVKKAEAEAEQKLVTAWRSQCPEDWKATATFLERRYPERWGRRERVNLEHTGKDGGPIDVNHRFRTVQAIISSPESRAEIAKAWRDKRNDDETDDFSDSEC